MQRHKGWLQASYEKAKITVLAHRGQYKAQIYEAKSVELPDLYLHDVFFQ